MTDATNSDRAFLEAATVSRQNHSTGDLARAESIRAAHPTVTEGIFGAAVVGNVAAIERHLSTDPGAATRRGGPHDWDPLTHLCFSRYLRLDRGRSAAFVEAARALLDHGANPDTGWFEQDHQPKPMWESAIYGAAGVAQQPELTRLLLERGADPNDGETPYHVPETHDNATLRVLIESGKCNEDSLTTLLLRKADWHDLEGIRYLLDHGADPNRTTFWGKTAFHNALLSDNSLAIVEAFLDHGADPMRRGLVPDHSFRPVHGTTIASVAARRGRGDVLATFERRTVPFELTGVDRLIGACARADDAEIRALKAADPDLVDQLIAEGGTLLAQFSGNGNRNGVARLLDLGVPATAVFAAGDGYSGIAPASTALHVAAWRAAHEVVPLLIERGTPIEAVDGQGRTAIQLAVKAAVDSYWSYRRAPDSIEALLRAGASTRGIAMPTGYPEADALLTGSGR